MKKSLLTLVLALGVGRALAQIAITDSGSTSQDFDTLPNSSSVTFSDDITLPGWFAQRTGTGLSIWANDGSSNAGNLYSYGAGTATDRALGTLGSGNMAIGSFAYGVQFRNDAAVAVTFDTLTYRGEQWRNSAQAAQTVTFWYAISASKITDLTPGSDAGWTALPSLDFTSPITGGTVGALNGNLAANRVTLSEDLNITLNPGEFVLFRWSDPDHSNADHGLSIDDFSVSYTVIPEPATMALMGLGALVLVFRRRKQG